MQKADFLQLLGADAETEYAPVAGMLRDGYGFAGHFNARLNKDLRDACVILNARFLDLRSPDRSSLQAPISDFNQFVEEIVLRSYTPGGPPEVPGSDVYGRSIPLAAVAYEEIVVAYPVARIGEMMEELQREKSRVPSFLDLDDKSIVLKILRTKLW
ncbi:MAG: hypothetical protein ACYS1C_04720 [Planctomycetota bacterium]|jgi:hypothetical protein